MSFGEAADELIRRTRQDRTLGWKIPKWKMTLLILSDGEWHGTNELARANHRFSVDVLKLRELHIEVQDEPDPHSPEGERWWRYRLVKRDDTGTQAMF